MICTLICQVLAYPIYFARKDKGASCILLVGDPPTLADREIIRVPPDHRNNRWYGGTRPANDQNALTLYGPGQEPFYKVALEGEEDDDRQRHGDESCSSEQLPARPK